MKTKTILIVAVVAAGNVWASFGPLSPSAAPYVRRGKRKGEGVQIDLLLQTKKSVCVVEIKRRNHVPASVEDEVRDKIRRLKLPRDISVRAALVYDGELAPELEENNYFDFLVPAARLFD